MENFPYNPFLEMDENSLCSEREYLVGNACPYSYQERESRIDTTEGDQCSLMEKPKMIDNCYSPMASFQYHPNRKIPKRVDGSYIKLFSYNDSDVRRRTDSDEIYQSSRINSDKGHDDSKKLARNKTYDVVNLISSTDSDECYYDSNLGQNKAYEEGEIVSSNYSDINSSDYKRVDFGSFITSEKNFDELTDSSESVKSSDIEYEKSNPLIFFPPGDHRVKRAKREAQPKPFTFITPLQSWKRVFEKYSPSTEILHSPVKHIEANILPNVTLDDQLLGLVWVCGMSEQFYYDNSIILLQKYFSNPFQLKAILSMNSRNVDSDFYLKHMVDVNILGSGTFGDVYRVKKQGTEEYFAVKYLKKMPEYSLSDHTESLMSYLKEKNFLLQARNSPYVVQFITSMKFPKINGLFLFFEWCICDLRKYINYVHWHYDFSFITDGIWYGENHGIAKIFNGIFSQFQEDLFSVSVIYIFEIFCAIAFLADCNLVHQDLKPENIMISTTFHLKIGDFGLAYNTKFITRKSQIYFIKSSDINLSESSNYGPVWGGTPTYEDMELCYRHIVKTNPPAIRLIDRDENNFPFKLMNQMQDADPNFLSDLWSCGIMALELLLGGLHFFQFGYFSTNVIHEMKLTGMFQVDLLRITYNQVNNKRYIDEGLRRYGGEHLEDLMEFIATIFLPRSIRSVSYRQEKEVYRYKNKTTLAFIDISKIEKINIFENYGLHNYNAFLFNMPLGLRTILSKPLQPKYNNLSHLLQNIIEGTDVNIYNIAPGIQGMYF